MAALSTYSGSSELTEIIPTELITEFIASYQYTPRVAEQVVRIQPSVGSVATRFPRWNALSVPAGTKSETDTFTDANIDMGESSLTPGMVGFRLPISLEAVAAAPGIPAAALVESMNALLDRMDADALSGSTSATNTSGTTGDVFTVEKFRAAAAAYRALNISGPNGHAAVLHHDAFRDLEESLGASAATLEPKDAIALGFDPEGGYMGSYHGFKVFSTGNIPSESPGWSSGMTPIGSPYSGLGLAVSEGVSVIESKGNDSDLRAVRYFIFKSWYAGGLVNPNKYLEILSRT